MTRAVKSRMGYLALRFIESNHNMNTLSAVNYSISLIFDRQDLDFIVPKFANEMAQNCND